MLQNQLTVSISKHGILEVVLEKEDQSWSCRHFFPPVNIRGLPVKPSLMHGCPVTAQSAQRSEREQMWQNHSALKWHKRALPSSSQGPHTSAPQSSAGQLWWREISSNEMEHEKSDEIATNKGWFLERKSAPSATDLMKLGFYNGFVPCGWILCCEYQLKLFLWLGQS